jgi:hypothetical protein
MSEYIGDGWRKKNRGLKTGWMKRVEDRKERRDFEPTKDALVRVFYFHGYGYVAYATLPDGAKEKFAYGTTWEESVFALLTKLNNKYVLNSRNQLCWFKGDDWKQFDTMAAKAQFLGTGHIKTFGEAELVPK